MNTELSHLTASAAALIAEADEPSGSARSVRAGGFFIRVPSRRSID